MKEKNFFLGNIGKKQKHGVYLHIKEEQLLIINFTDIGNIFLRIKLLL